MLKRIAVSVVCILAVATMAAAQRPEIFVGYTNLQGEGMPNRNDPNWVFDTDFFRARTTLHGVNASVTAYNEVGIGLTGDFSFARSGKTENFTGGSGEQNTDIYYVLGGPTVKFARSSRVQPFTRIMAGFAYTRFKVATELSSPVGTTTNSFVLGATDFSASVGGGVDVRVSDNVKLRVFQMDWAPVFYRDRNVDVLGSSGVIEPTTLNGQRQDNFRFSVGVTF